MPRPATIVGTLVVAGFIGYLAWSTLSAQEATCEVCVEFGGQRNCATASGADSTEASRSAQATACGPVTNGMDESIACANRIPPVTRCSTS